MKIDFISLIDQITQIDITNHTGLEISFLTYGAAVYRLKVPNKDEISEDVILSQASIQEFISSSQYFGKTIGRTAGRIKNNLAYIQGQKYVISGDSQNHALHGGEGSWAFKNFQFDYRILPDRLAIIFTYISPNYESNLPGLVKCEVTYEVFQDENKVLITYHAETSEATLINLTNHTYFNLSGNNRSPIVNHTLTMNTPEYYAIDEELCLKDLHPVTRIMDFTKGKKIGEHLFEKSLVDSRAKGYDHTFTGNEDILKVSLFDEVSRRHLEIISSLPAINVYTDNYPSLTTLIDGSKDILHSGIALEPEFVPLNFDDYTFHREQPYHHFIQWTFTLR